MTLSKTLHRIRALEKQIAAGNVVAKSQLDYLNRQLLKAQRNEEIAHAKQQKNQGVSEENK